MFSRFMVLCILLLSGCSTVQVNQPAAAPRQGSSDDALPAGWARYQDRDLIYHRYYRLAFPEQIGALKRGRVTNHDEKGLNSSVVYHGPEHNLTITFYVEPAGKYSHEQYFAGCIKAIQHVHPNAEGVNHGSLNIGQDEQKKGLFAFFIIPGLPEYQSVLLVFKAGPIFLKYRASYEAVPEAVDYGLKQINEVQKNITLLPSDNEGHHRSMPSIMIPVPSTLSYAGTGKDVNNHGSLFSSQ